MNYLRDHRIRVVIIGLAIFALFVLVAGLPGFVLDPGMPLQRIMRFLADELGGFNLAGPAPGGVSGDSETTVNILRTIFTIIFAAFPISVILILLDPEARKRVLGAALRILLMIILLNLFLTYQSEEVELEGEEPGARMPQGEAPLPEPIESETFDAESVSPWVTRGLSLVIGLAVALLLVWIGKRVRDAYTEEKMPLQEIADQAEAAIVEIERGGDFRNTILRCYAEMTRIVEEQLALQRGRTVTAREFIDFLLRARLPEPPVRRLTSLFEEARYGSGEQSTADEEQAVASLRAIAEACRKATAS